MDMMGLGDFKKIHLDAKKQEPSNSSLISSDISSIINSKTKKPAIKKGNFDGSVNRQSPEDIGFDNPSNRGLIRSQPKHYEEPIHISQS